MKYRITGMGNGALGLYGAIAIITIIHVVVITKDFWLGAKLFIFLSVFPVIVRGLIELLDRFIKSKKKTPHP